MRQGRAEEDLEGADSVPPSWFPYTSTLFAALAARRIHRRLWEMSRDALYKGFIEAATSNSAGNLHPLCNIVRGHMHFIMHRWRSIEVDTKSTRGERKSERQGDKEIERRRKRNGTSIGSTEESTIL